MRQQILSISTIALVCIIGYFLTPLYVSKGQSSRLSDHVNPSQSKSAADPDQHLTLIKTNDLVCGYGDLSSRHEKIKNAYLGENISVIEASESEVKEWIAKQRPHLKDADSWFQYLEFAEAHGANAIGGLTCLRTTDNRESVLGTWIINRSRFTCHSESIIKTDARVPVLLADDFDNQLNSKPVAPRRPVEPGHISLGAPEWNDLSCRSFKRIGSDNPYLGIGWFQTTADSGSTKVDGVEKDSPAFAAHIEAGDSIVALNGNAISSVNDLKSRFDKLKPGDDCRILLRRGNETREVLVKLGDSERPLEVWRGIMLKGLSQGDFQAFDGGRFDKSLFKGDSTLICFWGTDWERSRNGLLVFQMIAKTIKRARLQCVGICVSKDENKWKDIVKRNALKGVQFRIPELASAYGVTEFPSAVFLNDSGEPLGKCSMEDAPIYLSQTFLNHED